MDEDIFDVVDAQDRVIGQKPRSQVHAEGLRHRAVHLLVWNTAGQVLLQERSAKKDRHPLTWDSSCSGHVDSGEDYETAAERELGEELGLSVTRDQWQFLFKIEAREETGQEFVHVYRLRHEGPFVVCPEEIKSIRWFQPAEVETLIARTPEAVAPALRYLWARAQAAEKPAEA